jgi:hypothetical protein
MREEIKGISSKAISDLNILTIRAIGMVQRVNESPGRVDMDRVFRSLDEIEIRAKSVRKEIGQRLSLVPIGNGPGGAA